MGWHWVGGRQLVWEIWATSREAGVGMVRCCRRRRIRAEGLPRREREAKRGEEKRALTRGARACVVRREGVAGVVQVGVGWRWLASRRRQGPRAVPRLVQRCAPVGWVRWGGAGARRLSGSGQDRRERRRVGFEPQILRHTPFPPSETRNQLAIASARYCSATGFAFCLNCAASKCVSDDCRFSRGGRVCTASGALP